MPGLATSRRRQRQTTDFTESVQSSDDDTRSVRSTPTLSSTASGVKRVRLTPEDEDVDPGVGISDDERSQVFPDGYRAEPQETPDSAVVTNPFEEPYQPGAIIRIKLKNFVTYSSAEFRCGPSLNMIIGPNGTGKSTLVCAICLGLGGKPDTLGRAKEVGEYVKYGCREGSIEIELAAGPGQNGRNPKIRRIIKREGNKSAWSINGSPCNQKKVIALANSMHIQIDNLCQFLPQDKVVEFSRMTPITLLQSTQEAAGSEEMTKWHDELKDLGRNRIAKLNDKEAAKAHLERLQARQAAQKSDVDKLKERGELELIVRALRKGRLEIEYQEEKGKYEVARDRKKEAQQELARLKEELEPALQEINSKEEYIRQVERVAKSRRLAHSKLQEIAQKDAKKVQDHKTLIDECDKNASSEARGEKERKQRVIGLRNVIAQLQGRLNDEPERVDAAEFNERIREKEREIREISNQRQELKETHTQIRSEEDAKKGQYQKLEKELEKFRSKDGKKLAKLKATSTDTYRAWEWIQENRHRFQGQVFGPAIVECSMKDTRFAYAIESVLSLGDMTAITVTNKPDFQFCQSELLASRERGGQNLHDINLRLNTTPMANFERPLSSEELSHFGLECWAIDQITGPEPVLSMLCDSARIHKVALSRTKIPPNKVDELKESAIPTWVAGDQVYSVSRRREYGPGAVSTLVKPTRPARVFTDQVDTDGESNIRSQMESLKQEMDGLARRKGDFRSRLQDLDERDGNLKKLKTELASQKAALQKAYSEWQALPQKIANEQGRVGQLVQRGQEVKERLEEIRRKKASLSLERAQYAINFSISALNFRKSLSEVYDSGLRLIEGRNDLEYLHERDKEVKNTITQQQSEIDRLSREQQTLKASSLSLARRLREQNDARTEEEQEIFEKFKDRFEGEQLTLAHLDAEVSGATERLALLHTANPNILREFEQRARDIDQLLHGMATVDGELQRLGQEIGTIRGQWEPQLTTLVEKISDAFSLNFDQIGCAGQVRVHKDEEDYGKWAIIIEVKFREHENLSQLDSQRQSGGERAVSTIFYLMALQSLARAPFRVVDEINQGMDPRNERMVHERMVQIACAENTSQYFLITPKLLTGLKYHPRMAVHTVYSGESMPEDNGWLDFGRLADVALRVVKAGAG